jgi:hypothetical protein
MPSGASDDRGAIKLGVVPDLTVEQIGMADPLMRELLNERARQEDELSRLLNVLHFGEQHPHLIAARQQLERTNERIRGRAAEWLIMQAQSAEGKDNDSARLARTLAGVVDIFFDPSELLSGKPAISGATFEQVVELLGRKMLRFTRAGEQWLVDPARIIAIRRAR